MSPIFLFFSSASAPVPTNDRYWVGGTETWNATAGTKWSYTSGGSGGAPVPTSADSVYFDANSGGGVITLSSSSVCKDFICTGYTGTVTHPAATALTVHGEFLLDSGMTYSLGNASTSSVTFAATDGPHAITTDGLTIGSITFNGTGGSWALADNLSCRNITLTAGAFDTADFDISAFDISISGTTTRSIDLGSSSISCILWTATTVTNLTFTRGTSEITIGNNSTFNGGGLTYYNVTYDAASLTSSSTVAGANTFNNFSYTGTGVNSVLNLSANQTVSGTFTIANTISRTHLKSSAFGTARTVTAAAIALSNVDVEDITAAGASSPWNLSAITGLSGNCGGNSNITFTTPTTCYWVGNGGTWTTASQWAISTGGTPASVRVPLPQDTAVFDANSITSGSQTIIATSIGSRFPSVDMSAVLNSPTFSVGTSANSWYGDVILAAGVTISGNGQFSYSGRVSGPYTVSQNGATLATGNHSFSAGTNYNLGSNLTTASTFTMNGDIDLNDFDVTCTIWNGASGSQTILLGSGTLTATGTSTIGFNGTVSGFNPETSTLVFSNTSASTKTFNGRNMTYYNLQVSGASGAGTWTMNNANTFNNVTFDPNSNIRLASNVTTTITGNIFATGSSGNTITVQVSSTSNHTISKASGTVNWDWVVMQKITGTGGATFNAGANSTDNGDNTGWVF